MVELYCIWRKYELNRALKEYRDLMKEFLSIISALDDEWGKIISYAKPKCEILGYCPEKNSCGKYPQKI